MSEILKFPISLVRDSKDYKNWKHSSGKTNLSMEQFAIEAIREKCELIMAEERK